MSNTSSNDPDGTVEDYKWYLTGDGDTNETGSKVNYTYEEKGTYEVKLTVTDPYTDREKGTRSIPNRRI